MALGTCYCQRMAFYPSVALKTGCSVVFISFFHLNIHNSREILSVPDTQCTRSAVCVYVRPLGLEELLEL